MASKVEIDIPGIGLIEAKNAASEETLLEILRVLEGNQKSLTQIQKGNKGGAGAAAGGAGAAGAAAGAGAAMGASLSSAGKAAGALGSALGVAGKVAGVAGKALGGAGMAAGFAAGAFVTVAGAGAKAVGALSNLGQSAIGVANDLASMGDSVTGAANAVSKAFSSLPGVLGQVGSLVGAAFTAVAGSADRLVGAYQTAASVGATFGGSLNSMTAAASGAGMTLEKFSGLIQKNGEALTYLGGTTEGGAKRFAQLSKELRTGQAGAELLRLGYSTEQVNSGMAAYIGMMGKTGALQNMSTQQIAKSSAAYLKDLDALAKITGQTREEKQKEQEALMKDAQFRAAVAGMDAESAKQMMNYITSFPKEQQAAIKDMIATGTATSEESVKFAAMMPNAANQAMAFGRTLQAGGKITQDQMNRSRDAAIGEAKQNVIRYKAQGQFNKEMGEAYVGMAELAGKTAGDWAQAQKEGTEATKKANQAEQIEKFKQRIAEVSNSFTELLANSGMLDTLMKAFEGLVSIISTYVIPIVKGVFSVIQSVLPPVIDAVVAAFQALWPVVSTIASAMIGFLSPAIDGVRRIFGGLNDTTGGLSSTIEKIVDSVFPVLNAAFRGLIIVGEGVVKGFGYLVQPVMNLVGSIANLFGGTEGLKNIFLTVGNIVGTTFEYIGVVGGIVIDVFKYLVDAVNVVINGLFALFTPVGIVIDIFKDLISKSSFLSSIMSAVGQGFEYLKMLLSPAGVQAMFNGLKYVVDSITDFVGTIIDGFKEVLAGIFSVVGKFLPSFKARSEELEKEVKESREARKEAADQREKDLKKSVDHMKHDYATKKNRVENEKAAIAQDQVAYKQRKDQIGKIGALNKAEEDAKKAEVAKAEGPGEVDMSSPMAMLESFSRQQGGFFADKIDKARKEQAIAKEQKAIEEEAARVHAKVQNAKTDAEKESAKAEVEALKQRMKAFEEMVSGAKPSTAPAGVPSPAVAPTKLPAGSQVQGLGAVAAHFEAGGKAGTVSTGHGDFGGKSYGAFQLSSKTGDVDKFLEKSGYAKQFAGMKVGSAEFDAKWKELGATKEFAQAQAAHAKTTHYDPQMQKLSKAGLDMSGRGAGVQEAIMSTANQYGANTDLIMKALKDKDTSKMSDKDIINAIQDYKAQTVQTRFKSSSSAVQAGVAKRIEQERAMLLGVEGGPPAKAEAGKPTTSQPATAKPEQTKPGEVKPKTDAQKTLDWAYSIFTGKATMSQVPKPYIDEVGKILSNPPKNWAVAPKVGEPKFDKSMSEDYKAAADLAKKIPDEVKPKLEDASVKNWAYAVFEGKLALGQVPQLYREKVAAFLKNPPKEWSKAPSDVKPEAAAAKVDTGQAKVTEAKPTNEEFEINGKKVSKEEFDQFMKDNPQAAQMMDMAKSLQNTQGLPGPDMLQKMGGALPIGTDNPVLPEKILGDQVDPTQLFKTKLADLGAGNTEYKINGKPVSKEEFDKLIESNPAMKNMMGQLEGAFAPPTIDPTEMFKTQLNSMGQDGEFKINGKPVSKEEFDKAIGSNPALQNMMGSVAQMATPGTALPEVTKTNMADDVAAKREEEAKARKMLFESMGESQDPSSPKSKRGASGSSGTTLGGQEGGPNLVELLNTKLEQLININQNIANVNNDQLRVQRNLNFSGNVYNSAG